MENKHDICYLPILKDAFKGYWLDVSTDFYRKRSYPTSCLHFEEYVTTCLFGGRVAEVTGDFNSARLLYNCAKEIVDSCHISVKSKFSRNFPAFYKRALKRMYKIQSCKVRE